MKDNVVVKIILCVVLIGIIAALGGIAYQAGMVSGQAQGETVNDAAVPYVYHYGIFGFPFMGVFAIIIPLILICMAIRVLDCIFWGGRGRWKHFYRHGPWRMYADDRWNWDDDTPPFFDEWHRRAHEKKSDEAAEKEEV